MRSVWNRKYRCLQLMDIGGATKLGRQPSTECLQSTHSSRSLTSPLNAEISL